MPRVGMIGGGQLARMTHQAAIALGQSLRVLAVSADDSAAQVAADVHLGSHLDLVALTEFSAGCDVVTFDHEHVPADHIRALVAAGHVVHPGADALRFAQDKAVMRRRLAELGVAVPEFVVIQAGTARDDALRQVAEFAQGGRPVVVKTARGGYDGRGVWILRSGQDVVDTLDALATESGVLPDLVVEELVTMHRELAAVVARSPFGQAASWPVVESVQRDGICVEVIAPAPGLSDERASAAERLALRLAGDLGVVGVMAVELFEVDPSPANVDGLLVNELAMRPHNSGHWSMDGAVTGQFEQHLRAVLDYPLGRTDALAPFTVMANVLGGPDIGPGAEMRMDERVHHLAARFPDVKIHLYGKAFRPGRKLGHVNVLGSDLPDLRLRAGLAAAWLGHGSWDDGYRIDGTVAAPDAGEALDGAGEIG